MSLKESLLVIYKIFRLSVNALTTDNKYSLFNRENLMQPIQMQLFKKQKPFCQFFLSVWDVDQILKILKKKKMTLMGFAFSKMRTAKDVVILMSKKFCSRRPFAKQHGKWSERVMESAQQHLHYS